MAFPDNTPRSAIEQLPALEREPDVFLDRPAGSPGSRGALALLAPLAGPLVAIILYALALPGGFAFDDRLIETGQHLLSGTANTENLARILYDGYWEVTSPDRDYRPFTFLSYAINFDVWPDPAGFHFVNMLLHALAAVLAYFLLHDILRDRLLAALGAALYAALPILADAVGSLTGRAEVLSGIAVLAAWLIALKNSPPRAASPGEDAARADGPALAFLCGLVTFVGLFAKENAAVLIPVLIVLSSLLLGRPVPWKTAGAAAFAVAGYLLIAAVMLSGRARPIRFLENPLSITSLSAEDPRLDPRLDHLEGTGKDPILRFLRQELGVRSDTPLLQVKLALTRALNSIRLLGHYALKTLVPIRLSADYSYNQIQVLGPGRWELWAWVGGVVLVLAGAIFFLRKTMPLAALAAVVFLVALIPQANLFSYARSMFAERYAYAAAFALPLVLGAVAGRARSPLGRKLACALLAALILPYAFRTALRAREWSDPIAIMEKASADAPESTLVPLWSAWKSIETWQQSWPKGPHLRPLLERAQGMIEKSLRVDPTNARAHALYADVFLYQGKHAEAMEQLNLAEEGYLRQYPPERKPMLYQRRAEVFRRLQKPQEAFEDYDLAIRLIEAHGQMAQGATYYSRALLRALLAEMAKPVDDKRLAAELAAALHDFDRALLVRQDEPAIWNDRGYCRFKLKDYEGAIEDYQQGLEVAREKGDLSGSSVGSHSVRSFHERIAMVYMEIVKRERAAGNEGSAKAAQAEVVKHAREAARLGSLFGKATPPAPAPGPAGDAPPAPAPAPEGTASTPDGAPTPPAETQPKAE